MINLHTEVTATIGPATLDFDVFQKLIDEGVDYVRINTSYGDYQQYDKILNNLKKSKKQKPVRLMFDLKGVEMLDYVKKNDIKILAVSFAETREQIDEYRKLAPGSFIISKIESAKGVDNFDEVLKASDGIMFARGDLGEAIALEKLPPLQKDFTRKTIAAEKFLITATEMLLSMVNNPKPTRAEVSDVANAVFENASAVMLSEETAIGKYPVECVKMMRKIIAEAEKWVYERKI